MKKLILILVLPLFFGFKAGDEIDEKRMNRDLEIAKNILATLIKSNADSWFGGSSIDASYIRGYGVVFTIPEHLVYFHRGGNLMVIPEMPPMPDVEVEFDFDEDFEFSEKEIAKAEKEMKKQKEIMKQHEKAMKKQQFEMQKQAEEMARAEADIALSEEREMNGFLMTSEAQEAIDWEEIMITFMTDYADLIGQLEPDEMVVVKQNAPHNDLVFIWSDGGRQEKIEKESGNISAEVSRKDISAYKSGKIKKDEFISRIDIKKAELKKKVPDLEMFANIFDRFYSRDLSETFYSQSKPRYEVLDGFGAVFYIETSSGSRSSYIRARSSGTNSFSYSVAPDADAPKDEELYLKFKEDIKAFMLDYGRTIRSLDADDKVLLNIKINSCRDCSVPQAIEVSTKMSVLKNYDQQKLSREKAENQIEIKEN